MQRSHKIPFGLICIGACLAALPGFFWKRAPQVQHPNKILASPTPVSKIEVRESIAPPQIPGLVQALADKHQQNPKRSALAQEVEREGALISTLTDDPDSIQRRLVRRASSLTPNEIKELQSLALKSDLNHDERYISAYLLNLAGAKAHAHLQNIFFHPIPADLIQKAGPHTIYETNLQFEYAIRTLALEGLEKNIHQKSQAHLSLSDPQQRRPASPYLKGLLQIAQMGEKYRRPLLKKFIEKNIDQVML